MISAGSGRSKKPSQRKIHSVRAPTICGLRRRRRPRVARKVHPLAIFRKRIALCSIPRNLLSDETRRTIGAVERTYKERKHQGNREAPPLAERPRRRFAWERRFLLGKP